MPMNAADVMASKVISVRADTSVETIAETLLANRISAVPVVNDSGALLGIVSEGDLMRRVEAGTEWRRSWWLDLLTRKQVLAQEFVKSHARKAADVMTRPVITVTPDTPLSEIATLFEKHGIKRVPVVKDHKIVGIVSRANLVQAMIRLGKKQVQAESVTDSALQKRILAELNSKLWADPSSINVIVEDGTVELWGFVETETEKDALRVAIEVIPGVRDVQNKIVIGKALPAF
jgi:CBS-domain-containing membrane protein